MKRFLRILGRLMVVLLIIIIAVLLYVKYALPYGGEIKAFKLNPTEALVKRGEYLANNVAVCIDCHSQRDWTKYSGPIKPGTIGMGGEYFGKNIGLPGDFYATNITPFSLKKWSDEELYHLITTGINKDGEAMFPIMPYKAYANMAPEDVKAIIAYLRTLDPVQSKIPERSIDFPMNFIINTIPSEATPMKRPKPSEGLAYGKYLTTIAACADCHTPQEKGAKIEGKDFAGGFEFKMPFGVLRSPNITNHETGIASWTREAFIERFRSYNDSSNILTGIKPKEFNTVMPWTMYAGMKEEDLGAIYDYLRTVKPVKNEVVRFNMKK